ncbi:OLC1v1001572C1 [Oldenlandia corymbosa var. corymbosa]|uniref:OLC1v1001572C1 n=1 Tax=Oldenlandia corymbosa var. corymbosa TaxID=529605 RepID=A0AAV1D764_OLDCO|nr:OLC1v1001572C1 [Oldenlandia corymbosa var. corymbosa]
MEGNLEKSPQLGSPDEIEAKYISGLSTVLVATVQEAKDRISQIEYVFCSQLYPHFQAKSKTLQKLYSEARESVENHFIEKEKDLLVQIEKLQQEKQQLCDEMSVLKLGREEFDKIGLSPDEVRKLQKELNSKNFWVTHYEAKVRELDKTIDLKDEIIEFKTNKFDEWHGKYFDLRDQYRKEVEELKSELANQTKIVDAGMYLQNELLRVLQSYAPIAADKEEPLEGLKDKADLLLGRVKDMVKKISELQKDLKHKTQEVEKGRVVETNLLRKIESQGAEIMDYEQQSSGFEKEKKVFTTKLESLENDVDSLRKEISKKNDEVEEGRKVKEQLIQQIDLHNLEKVQQDQKYEELKKEKLQLLAKLAGSIEKSDICQATAHKRGVESSEDTELNRKLLQEIEAKDSQLMFEKQKRKDVIVAYKKLKSQYNFLCSKYGLTKENATPLDRKEEESDSLRHNQHKLLSADQNAHGVSSEASSAKSGEEGLDNDKGVQSIQRSNSVSPSSTKFVQPKSATKVKSCPPAGTKRPVSYWRDTRSHQSRVGPDLHDDFLDTPLEKIREDMGNGKKDGVLFPEKLGSNDSDFDNSDDETQDMDVEHKLERPRFPSSGPGTSDFKYVEPVRKKSARENLKGIECKQCKKFYDAVLPNESKDADGNAQNLRCEHHDGVSRHRYRYAPPLTPEGFWNIGFESEM